MRIRLLSFLIAGVVAIMLLGRPAIAQDRAQLPPPPSPVIQPADAPRGPFVDVDSSPMTVEKLIGVWTTNTACRFPLEFRADGTYTLGSSSGLWAISDGTVTRTNSEGRTFTSYVNPLDANTFALGADVNATAVVIYIRCSP